LVPTLVDRRYSGTPSDRTLQARGRDFVVIQTEDGPENLFGMLAQQQRRARLPTPPHRLLRWIADSNFVHA